MVTKKARSEYMKKFKDPKWETFSRCYEDCLKYRLTRRVMEGAHKPWFWEGWDSSSESSGWSTPRGSKNRVVPLSVAPPDTEDVTQRLLELKTSPGPSPGARHHCEGEAPEVEPGGGRGGDGVDGTNTEAAVVENGPNKANTDIARVTTVNGLYNDTTTDNGPMDSASSDGEILNPRPRPRHRRPPRNHDNRAARSHDDRAVERKAPRAKSQPPTSSKDKERLDWTQTHMEARRTPNNNFRMCHLSEPFLRQTPDTLSHPTLDINNEGAACSSQTTVVLHKPALDLVYQQLLKLSGI